MPNSFTPQQIEEFLQEFFDVVGARQYIGARYVPIFGRSGEDTVEWDDGAPYEPLTVVMHLGVSYVSRRYVPTGTQITNTDYWVETYRFNAQVEQYRQEVLSFQGQIDQIREDYVPFPDPNAYPKYGTTGQVLSTLSNGETKWEDPVVPSDAQAEEVITAWLTAHPEATTTVQDDSLTKAKFVPALRDEINGGSSNINATYTFGLQGTIETLTLPDDSSDPIVFAGSNNQAGNFGYITFNGLDYYCQLPSSPWSVNIPRYSVMCFSTIRQISTVQIKTIENLDKTDVVLLGYAMNPANPWVGGFTGILYERINNRTLRVLNNSMSNIEPIVDGNFKDRNATYTFGLQGTIETLTLPDHSSDPIVFAGSNNQAGNFGYITFNGLDYYCQLPSSPWSVNIPRFSVMCFSTIRQISTVQIKQIADLDEYDVVLLGYAMNPANPWVGGFTGILHERIDSRKTAKLWESYEPLKNNDKVMRSVCRFGEAYGQPESAAAILACNNAGFNIIRLNLQFTSDGVAVLWHDPSLNQNYHNVYDSNNELVPYSVDNNIKISDTTKAQLDQYKYGGVSYAAGIPTLDAALKQCRKLGMEVVLEAKMEYTQANLVTLKTIIDRYGMMKKVSITGATNENAIAIATALPKLRVGLQVQSFNTNVADTFVTLSGIADRLFWWGWNTMTLTSTIVEFLSQYGIDYECGSFASLSAIDTYLSGDFAWYCTGMEIQGSITPLIGQYLAGA